MNYGGTREGRIPDDARVWTIVLGVCLTAVAIAPIVIWAVAIVAIQLSVKDRPLGFGVQLQYVDSGLYVISRESDHIMVVSMEVDAIARVPGAPEFIVGIGSEYRSRHHMTYFLLDLQQQEARYFHSWDELMQEVETRGMMWILQGELTPAIRVLCGEPF